MSLLLSHSPIITYNVAEASLTKYDRVSYISCGSDSMGMAIRCTDKAYSRTDVLKPDQLIEGRIYTFQRDNTSVIHRLVKCLDNCTNLVFKGDNNKVADEIVHYTQLTGRVEMIEYK